jgi:ABC-2 type transport system permease protein
MNTFKWLLKREFWEHRGGFFWAPVVAGIVFLVITSMAIVAGESVRRNVDDGGDRITMNGVELDKLTETLTPKEQLEMAGGLDLGTLLAGSWPFIVLAFVVFFYCLGALYDDRKDRSILFWKSLPISDARTVGSKLASALLIAPVIATAAAIVTAFGFLVLLSVYAAYHGGNPINLIWGPASPLTVAFHLLAALPVYAVWALPTVGWLLLVSAWAKSKPFLWALLVPVFAGVLVSWFDVMEMFGSKAEWFWVNVVGRLLLGTMPGMDLLYMGASNPAMQDFNPDGPHEIVQLFSAQNAWLAFGSLQTWIGAVAGIAMIVAAIHFRRARDEG